MATSYTNPGGSGDRRTTVLVAINTSFNSGPPNNILDGSTTAQNFYFANTSATILEFWFPSKKIIDEAKFYQSDATSHGVWKWQGSNDRSTWTDVGGTFTLGGIATQTHTTLNGNSTGYVFYRLFQVSGVATSTPWIYEIEFKIDEGGTTSYLNPLGSGNRTATIVVSSSGITWNGTTDPTHLINGSYATQVYWNGAPTAGLWVQFDLGASVLLQQARWWLDSNNPQGDWKLQGSPDAAAWTDLSAAVTLGAVGAAGTPFVTRFGAETNTVAYRYYRFLGVSGTSDLHPYLLEVEFMVAATAAATAARVTQDAIEVLSLPTTVAARVSQDAVETLSALATGDAARVTQRVVEVLGGTVSVAPPTAAQVTQTLVELLTLIPPPTPAQVTQTVVELLAQTLVETRATQAVIELLAQSPPGAGDITQLAVEVYRGASATARTTQAAVEVFLPITIPTRTTQLALEVWTPIIVWTRNTQTPVEIYNAAPALTRMTQEAVELWLIVPPCTSGDFPIDDAGTGGTCSAKLLD